MLYTHFKCSQSYSKELEHYISLTRYYIKLKHCKFEWIVTKRYSQFAQLHKELTLHLARLKLPVSSKRYVLFALSFSLTSPSHSCSIHILLPEMQKTRSLSANTSLHYQPSPKNQTPCFEGLWNWKTEGYSQLNVLNRIKNGYFCLFVLSASYNLIQVLSFILESSCDCSLQHQEEPSI